MQSLMNDVAAFRRGCGLPIADKLGMPPVDRRELHLKLIREEIEEIYAALEAGMQTDDLADVADGLADLIYICIGAALELGIPLDKVWEEVQHANLQKFDPTTGKAKLREDGKVLKPEGWRPPDIAAVLRKYGLDTPQPNQSDYQRMGEEGMQFLRRDFIDRKQDVIQLDAFEPVWRFLLIRKARKLGWLQLEEKQTDGGPVIVAALTPLGRSRLDTWAAQHLFAGREQPA